ncbi:MAG: hypothetical protein QOE83_341 [Actinomycetota bacterium]|nr:hypothetical protein [Actinomycetota bacterium]
MDKRYTAVGLFVAFIIGAAAGGFAWSRFASDPVPDARGGSTRDTQSESTHTKSPKLGRGADLLDVVDSLQSISGVESCRMVEMYDYQPLGVRAFCATASGDELRIVYHNDSSSQESDVTGYCDQGEGPGFIPPDARWSVYQVSRGDTSGPDQALTAELSRVLKSDPVRCP